MTVGDGDELLRPALELALDVARAGEEEVPAVPAPRALVRFLRFRQVSVSDRALAAVRKVVDEDEAFRSRVRAAAGGEEAVGRPSWLFLDRPPGWSDELSAAAGSVAAARSAAASEREEASAVRRLAAAEDARARAETALASAQADVAEARARLADEKRARALADTELGRLRARLVAMEAELSEAASAEPVEPPAVHPEPPDPAPVAPAIDVATVDAALGSARAAVAALQEALSAASDAVAPPRRRTERRPREDGGRRPVPLPRALFEESDEAADFLVRVPGALVLVDGYNVTKLGWPDLSLPEQRRWLLDSAAGLAARTGVDLLLVFDGDDVPAPADRARRRGVEVRFSPPGIEADDVVLELAAGLPLERPVVVASNDRRVRDGARRAGTNVVSSDQLLALLGTVRRPAG